MYASIRPPAGHASRVYCWAFLYFILSAFDIMLRNIFDNFTYLFHTLLETLISFHYYRAFCIVITHVHLVYFGFEFWYCFISVISYEISWKYSSIPNIDEHIIWLGAAKYAARNFMIRILKAKTQQAKHWFNYWLLRHFDFRTIHANMGFDI